LGSTDQNLRPRCTARHLLPSPNKSFGFSSRRGIPPTVTTLVGGLYSTYLLPIPLAIEPCSSFAWLRPFVCRCARENGGRRQQWRWALGPPPPRRAAAAGGRRGPVPVLHVDRHQRRHLPARREAEGRSTYTHTAAWYRFHLSLLMRRGFWSRSRAQGILINNQFPGPQIDAVTNDNLVINVYNKLTEPFLLSWLVVLLSPPWMASRSFVHRVLLRRLPN
jgi:hypothetical protein